MGSVQRVRTLAHNGYATNLVAFNQQSLLGHRLTTKAAREREWQWTFAVVDSVQFPRTTNVELRRETSKPKAAPAPA